MDAPLQMKLPGVPLAKRGREVAPKWAWTQASVWTERMLATLERGVKGGKWYSLIDKVWSQSNLKSAMEQVCGNEGSAGVDEQNTEAFQRQSVTILPFIQKQLQAGEYQPKPVKRQWIEKLGSKELRPLGIPRSETEWCKARCATCSNPSSSTALLSTVMGFDRDEEPRMRCAEWINCSKVAATGSWMQT